MIDILKLRKDLESLERNERLMSPEQKKQYALQLERRHKRIKSLALKEGRDFLFSGVLLGDDGKYIPERIRSMLGQNEIADAERAALTVLFESYDLDRYIDILTPLHYKILYQGYGPYWASCYTHNKI